MEKFEDGESDPGLSKRIKTAWPIASVYYQPTKMLTIRGDIQEINTGTAYTAISPHADIGGHFSVRFRPTEKFYLEDSGVMRNQTPLLTDYHSTVRSNSLAANYDFNTHLTGFGGFSYDSIFASGLVNFLRGPVPFTNLTLRDQTVDRVWQAGIKANPTKRLGLEDAHSAIGKMSEDQMIKVVTDGKGQDMDGYGKTLTKDQIKGLVDYYRSLGK